MSFKLSAALYNPGIKPQYNTCRICKTPFQINDVIGFDERSRLFHHRHCHNLALGIPCEHNQHVWGDATLAQNPNSVNALCVPADIAPEAKWFSRTCKLCNTTFTYPESAAGLQQNNGTSQSRYANSLHQIKDR